MSKIKNIVRGGVLALGMAVFVAMPAFAAACVTGAQTGDYAGVYIGNSSDGETPPDARFPRKCGASKIKISATSYDMWGKTSADCTKAASLASNPDGCETANLNSIIQTIINTVIFVVGIIAVVMVILGGIQYSTSQGDSGKVKKAKDTIMYGIIGLVVAILAFAIVNFVLSSIF
ncbi:pilin [Candidatus Saccharibacteria bacterium]|nr:pilin [Candidatus Saccharibacteria bacterium]